MKKVFSFLLASLLTAGCVFAQDKAIGLKFGSPYALSGQMNLSDDNRIEANLGLYSRTLDLSGFYQWTKPLEVGGLEMGWFFGGGAAVTVGNTFGLSVLGQIGIEYTLPSFPLQFSLDYTPGIRLLGTNYWGGLVDYGRGGLSVRYKF